MALNLVAKHFGMNLAIKAFGVSTKKILSFGEDYDNPKYRAKPKLMQYTDGSELGTDMGTPLVEAKHEIERSCRTSPGSLGVVFVVSDSGANMGTAGKELQDLIRDTQRRFIVVNFILGAHPYELASAREYFGEKNVIAPKRFQDLPYEASRVLGKIFTRFKKEEATL